MPLLTENLTLRHQLIVPGKKRREGVPRRRATRDPDAINPGRSIAATRILFKLVAGARYDGTRGIGWP